MPRAGSIDWKHTAEAFAERVLLSSLHPRVVAWARSDSEAARMAWAVGFSGGADSLALIMLLWAHWAERRARLVALHFDHRLRGRASVADAGFCAQVCAGLGIRFTRGAWTEAPKRKAVSEAEARAARFAFFRQQMTRRRAGALWLGHQKEDVAETMLMRLARGSGTAGLAAPRPIQPMPGGRVHLRPLLTLTKAELVAALGEAGAVWREDATNATPTFARNRMRHGAIPAWQIAVGDRDVFSGAASSRELLEEDDVALEYWVDTLGALSSDGRRLDVKALQAKPRAVVRRALHRWLLRQADVGDLSRQGFEGLLGAVERGGFTRFSLGRSGLAVIRKGVLEIETNA